MPYSAVQYLLDDSPRTLFPMETTRYLVSRGSDILYDYLYKEVLAPGGTGHFLPQAHCYAAKTDFHLRRTFKLDPIAELFIYDVVYRNRRSFQKDHVTHRQNFGYRFAAGEPMSPMSSYRDFRKAVTGASRQFKYSLRVDVALYFNSIYHHDLVSYFSTLGWDQTDVNHLGAFLREINAGRSIDCLPQGLNPCKTIGAEFLKFIDQSARLRTPLSLRFLDDIYLFSNSVDDLTSDLLTIQQLLGDKGLSLNDAKTKWGEGPTGAVDERIDEIKRGLLELRQEMIEVSGEPVLVSGHEYRSLEPDETKYLLELLKDPSIDEADAELVLKLLTDHGEQVLERLADILPRFPVLSKSLFAFLGKTPVREGLDDILWHFLGSSTVATEYQLFWLTCCAQEFLATSPRYGAVLMKLFEHREATGMVQARVLEIPDSRFGLPELRASFLRSGESTWRAWSAAVGTRQQTPQSRNHLMSYFANGSPINRVIANVMQQ
jgi:hypothetical protein